MDLEFTDFRKGLDITIKELKYSSTTGRVDLTFEERKHRGWYGVSLKSSEATAIGLINPDAVYKLMSDMILKEHPNEDDTRISDYRKKE